jgi:hypothetical protein
MKQPIVILCRGWLAVEVASRDDLPVSCMLLGDVERDNIVYRVYVREPQWYAGEHFRLMAMFRDNHFVIIKTL